MLRRCLLLIGLGLILAQQPAMAQDTPEPKEIIVRFKNEATQIDKDLALKALSLRSRRPLSFKTMELIRPQEGQLEAVLAKLQQDPAVAYAEPDYYYQLMSTPNDPDFNKQWWLTTIQADKAWNITTGSKTVYVGLVDSGIDTKHPDLADKIEKTIDFTDSGVMVDKESPHGSSVAGVMAAATNNAIGVASTGYNVRILAAKVAANENGAVGSKVLDGIRWAADNGATVINLSLGGYDESQAMKEAIQYAWNKGAVIVAAAGNEATDKTAYPAAFENVIAVAATNKNDEKAAFSNYGNYVDLAAPGFLVYTTAAGSKYGNQSGTSFASPVVAGVAALIKSAFPTYTNQQIVDRLCSTADKIGNEGSYWRCGRVNAYQAVLGGGGGETSGPSSSPSTQTSTPTPTATAYSSHPPKTPTPTPNPGVTPPPGGVVLNLRFQGIDTQEAYPQKVTLEFFQNGKSLLKDTFEALAAYLGKYQVVLTDLTPLNPTQPVTLKIKGTSHLQKSLEGIAIASNQIVELSTSEKYLIRAGDTNHDNQITIEDMSQVSKFYHDFYTVVNPQNAEMEASDVNKDGLISIQDLALIAINWSDLTVAGDL